MLWGGTRARKSGGRSRRSKSVTLSEAKGTISSMVPFAPLRVTFPCDISYSDRSVLAGSTRAARHAGTPHASSATPASSPITPA